ncbi:MULTISPECIES: hypothetical protein [Bradyrhizobium]|uniref:hypothetical protein n=1 Tax=Bradyrhizobium TaxID=374 RepID=UPI002FE299D2
MTSRFFALSSYKGDKVWYDRCNSARLVTINYPASEERAWTGVVARISLSLLVDSGGRLPCLQNILDPDQQLAGAAAASAAR